LHLPDLKNTSKRSAMRLLVAMSPAAFFVSSKLLAVVLTRITRLSLRYGLIDASAYGFAGYGTVLAGVFGRYEEAYAFGQLALQVQERFKSPRFECRLLFQNGTYLTPWVRPYSEAKAQLREALAAGLRHGDTVYEAYSAGTISVITYCEAEELAAMQETAESSHAITTRRRDADMSALVSAHARYCGALRGLNADSARLGNDESDDATFFASLSVQKTPVAIFYYHFCNAQLAYLHDDLARAGQQLAEAGKHVGAIFAIPTTVDLELWRVLIGVRAHESASLAERLEYGVRALPSLVRLARWARLCPQNFEPHYRLARAELIRLESGADPSQRFAETVTSAREHGKRKWEAIALELAGRHHRRRGETAKADSCVRAAIDAYTRWGAAGRAARLGRLLGS
jgi:hypothetical protein